MNSYNWSVVHPDVSAVMGLVDTHIRYKNKKNFRGYDNYHPSEFGKCLRRLQYLRYATAGLISVCDETLTSKQIRLFDKGHSMHGRWQKYFADMGALRGIWQCSNPMCKMFNDDGKLNSSLDILKTQCNGFFEKLDTRKYGEENQHGVFKPEKCICGNKHFIYHEITVSDTSLNMLGHADIILDFSKIDISLFKDVNINFDINSLPKIPVVVDMKTINDYRFKQLLREGPGLEYIIQLVIYANILNCPYGILIYENKNASDVVAYKVDKDQDSIFDIVVKQVNAMNEMAKHNPPLLPPPRPSDQDNYECKYCCCASLCLPSKIWKDPNLDEKRKKFYRNMSGKTTPL